jgi:hypothetical protein
MDGALWQTGLNATRFMLLNKANGTKEAQRTYYNKSRPRFTPDNATPAEFARRWWLQPAAAIS